MGKPFGSNQLEIARNRRDSLEVFGQGPLQFGTSATGPLFSNVEGSAWNDALRAAEMLLQETQTPSAAAGTRTRQVHGRSSGKTNDLSLEDVILELEAAEKGARSSPGEWEEVLPKSQTDARRGKQNAKWSYDEHGRRSSSDWGSRPEAPEVFHEVISERAAQWGYGVVLKSSRDSTPRTSGGSVSGGSSGPAIPGVSKDVKDALSSFQLAFLVSDATHDDYPILFASAGFTTMTGYSADEAVGRNCRFLQGPDTDATEVGRVREALKEGGVYTGTLLNYKKDGTPFWNLLTISPIKDDEGKVIKYIGMQAEQTSKEHQVRNSKGQKPPAFKPLAAPIVQEVEKLKSAGEASQGNRRSSSSGLPRPPTHPQTSPAPAGRQSGSDILSEQPKRRSHRYSLSSSTTRSTRSSFAEECQPDWREAASRFRSGINGNTAPQSALFEAPETSATLQSGSDVLSGQPKRTSHRYSLTSSTLRSTRSNSVEECQPDWREAVPRFRSGVHGNTEPQFEAPETSASLERSEKGKSSRFTARIIRLFRKEKSNRKGTASSGREDFEFSDSGDEREDSVGYSARNSGTSWNSRSVFSSTRSSEQAIRPKASIDDICDRLNEGLVDSRGQPTASAPFDAGKRQFCIVHT